MGQQRTQDSGGRKGHARGHKASRAPGAPGLPSGAWGDTNRGGIADNGAVHMLQTHEDKGPATPTETKCSKMRSCACGEGTRAGAGKSVLSWQGQAATSSTPVTVHGPPRTTGKPQPDPGPADAAAWATTGCNVAGPSTGTPTSRRQPQPYANHTATGTRLLAERTRINYQHQRLTKTDAPTPTAARQTPRRTSRPYGDWHPGAPTKLLQNQQPHHKQTARKPANTKPAGHARVKTRTASPGLATPWFFTPADDHTHEHIKTPQLYHYTTGQPTATTYYEPPAPRKSACSTALGGLTTRHAIRAP